jgi:dCTP diphosphatase
MRFICCSSQVYNHLGAHYASGRFIQGSPEVDERDLKLRIRRFMRARRWEAAHSPKNLAMALTAEVGELVELFQWLTESQSRALTRKERVCVRDELADVAIYLLRLADVLHVDLGSAVVAKLGRNEARFPVSEFAGRLSRPRE